MDMKNFDVARHRRMVDSLSRGESSLNAPFEKPGLGICVYKIYNNGGRDVLEIRTLLQVGGSRTL